MDVKEAVSVAKGYLTEVFEEERITDIGLEEIEFRSSDSTWEITLGFSRPWDQRIGALLRERQAPARSYKVVRIKDHSGEVQSLKDRILTAAE